MRVNESESERTRSEGEHRRTSQNYQRAEIRVQSLQKDLKRAITKSRYYSWHGMFKSTKLCFISHFGFILFYF